MMTKTTEAVGWVSDGRRRRKTKDEDDEERRQKDIREDEKIG